MDRILVSTSHKIIELLVRHTSTRYDCRLVPRVVGWPVNVEIEPKSTFAAPLAASPWARAAPSRARRPYQPPPALGSRPASSAGTSCWAARQQEHDLRYVQRVVTAPLWLPSFHRRTQRERPSAPTASSRCAGEWRAPLPGDLSRLSEPRHCGRGGTRNI